MSPRPRPARHPENTPSPQRSQPTCLLIARGDQIQAIHLRPRTILLAGVSLALFSILYLGATAYLVLRDVSPGAGSEPQERLREQYEDRISVLRKEIKGINSRRLLDHATVEEKMDQLLDRQADLAERQDLLSTLADAARRAGLNVPAPRLPTSTGPQASAAAFAHPGITPASLAAGPKIGPANPAIGAKLDEIAGQIAAMEDAQDNTIRQMTGRVAGRVDLIATRLAELGRSLPAPTAGEDVGGPFIPLPTDTAEQRFEANVLTLDGEFQRLAAMRKVALALPLGEPLAEASVTSGYGPRLDPFLGRPAMHTGIDFRAPRGLPARAVAAGTVIAAEENGGYGKMVDVDHGNGVVTRYGHLSAITVHVGDKVATKGKIGRIGSSGRATGPHLHYEIRINDEPVNPGRFIVTGQELAALL